MALDTQRPVSVASTSHSGFGLVAHKYVSVRVTVVLGNVVYCVRNVVAHGDAREGK